MATEPVLDDNSDDEDSKPVHTLHKSQRFSRKLKRRLTQRTFAEARALKKQSKEAVHIVIYAAELVSENKITRRNHCIRLIFIQFRLFVIQNWPSRSLVIFGIT